jgi:hypothetical protein
MHTVMSGPDTLRGEFIPAPGVSIVFFPGIVGHIDGDEFPVSSFGDKKSRERIRSEQCRCIQL